MTLAPLAIVATMTALAALWGTELLPDEPDPALPSPAPAAAAPHGAAPPPPVADWTGVALARPLFAPDRRPLAAVRAASVALPRLAGTIRTDDTALAIFAPAGEGKPEVIGLQGDVAGWTVVEITESSVTLVHGAATTRLVLSFADLPVAPVPAGPPALVLLHDKRTSPFLQP